MSIFSLRSIARAIDVARVKRQLESERGLHRALEGELHRQLELARAESARHAAEVVRLADDLDRHEADSYRIERVTSAAERLLGSTRENFGLAEMLEDIEDLCADQRATVLALHEALGSEPDPDANLKTEVLAGRVAARLADLERQSAADMTRLTELGVELAQLRASIGQARWVLVDSLDALPFSAGDGHWTDDLSMAQMFASLEAAEASRQALDPEDATNTRPVAILVLDGARIGPLPLPSLVPEPTEAW